MKTTVAIFIFMISFSVFGQKVDSIKLLLNTRNFDSLNSYLNQLESDKEANCRSNLVRDRQVISLFHERIIDYEEYYRKNEEENIVKPYRIYLLTENETIVYCEMVYLSSFNRSGKPLKNRTEIKYSDYKRLEILKNEYLFLYNKKLSVTDFFTENVVFGDRCGFANEELEYRRKLNKIVKSKNVKKLDSWLTSPITELQVFAIEGLYQLKDSGYSLTDSQLKLINVIKSKQGKIKTCLGCIDGVTSISQVTEDFTF